jgi:hypothetical protein
MDDQGSDRVGPEMQPAAELLPVVYAELRRLAGRLQASGKHPGKHPGTPYRTQKEFGMVSPEPRPNSEVVRYGVPGTAPSEERGSAMTEGTRGRTTEAATSGR